MKTTGVISSLSEISTSILDSRNWKGFQIGTVRYNWPMSAHASQAFSIAHCTDSEDLPRNLLESIHRTDPAIIIGLLQEQDQTEPTFL